MKPPFNMLSTKDRELARSILKKFRTPDLIIAPDGDPYLYRWYLVPHNDHGNIYFHIQVRSDPERPLHDHPWDNMSNILSGYCTETMNKFSDIDADYSVEFERNTGDVIFRRATTAHRLILPETVPYMMTIFSTGPKIRDWGFWYPQGWINSKDVVRIREDGASIHVHPEEQK